MIKTYKVIGVCVRDANGNEAVLKDAELVIIKPTFGCYADIMVIDGDYEVIYCGENACIDVMTIPSKGLLYSSGGDEG